MPELIRPGAGPGRQAGERHRRLLRRIFRRGRSALLLFGQPGVGSAADEQGYAGSPGWSGRRQAGLPAGQRSGHPSAGHGLFCATGITLFVDIIHKWLGICTSLLQKTHFTTDFSYCIMIDVGFE